MEGWTLNPYGKNQYETHFSDFGTFLSKSMILMPKLPPNEPLGAFWRSKTTNMTEKRPTNTQEAAKSEKKAFESEK